MSSEGKAPLKVDGIRCHEFSHVLEDELKRHGIAIPPTVDQSQPEKVRLRELYATIHEQEEPLTALCLSGGGIRSATFNLGIIEGLAAKGILDKFTYLSTVSGGGYIGSWLSAWIRQSRKNEKNGCFSYIAKKLAKPISGGNELPQVRFLRDYSNYLSPRFGILTLDTWTLAAIYLTNLLINWLMLVPLFFAVLVIPRFYVAVLQLCEQGPQLQWQTPLLMGGLLLGAFGVLRTCMDLPTFTAGDEGKKTTHKEIKALSHWSFLLALLLSAVLLSLFWKINTHGATSYNLVYFVRFGGLMSFIGWFAGSLLYILRKWNNNKKDNNRILGIFFLSNVIAAISGAVGGGVAFFLVKLMYTIAKGVLNAPAYATLAVPAVMTAFLFAGVVFVLGMNTLTGDEDREWWGRAGALLMIVAIVWLVLFGAVIYGPLLLFNDTRQTFNLLDRILTAVGFGGLTGLITALIGQSKYTPSALKGGEQKENPFAKLGLHVGALLFAFLLVIILSSTATIISQQFQPGGTSSIAAKTAPNRLQPRELEKSHLQTFSKEGAHFLFWWLFCLPLGISLLVAWVMNPNKFSLHALYRTRLIRAYLGAVRGKRKRSPHPFTGFDPKDDIMMELLPDKPFHIINMTWNLVKGERLAWQERKGVSFTMSKLHCGSANFGYRPTTQYGKKPGNGNGLTLGTAMAISGAAVSPNMGYHSSPLITFVMAFFNLRLGWWLGNPSKNKWERSGPSIAFLPLLQETFGFTNSKSSYIYLSDGGHFENLGLYEMVRRRCRYIIVGDASCDPDSTFEDLGNAIRKIRVDLGIEIEIDLASLKPGEDEKTKLHYAMGTIKYSCVDGNWAQEGKLLYVKPSLCNDVPVDIYNYQKLHNEFPQQTTADQWFDESQFESYRKLGLHAIEHSIGTEHGKPAPVFQNVQEFFNFMQAKFDKVIAAE